MKLLLSKVVAGLYRILMAMLLYVTGMLYVTWRQGKGGE